MIKGDNALKYGAGTRISGLPALAASLGAAYDWGGESLPDVGAATGNWVCSRTGTVAVATGGPTVGTLGGRLAANHNQVGWFRAAFAAIPQPYAYVLVVNLLLASSRYLIDGGDGLRGYAQFPLETLLRVNAGANLDFAVANRVGSMVLTMLFAGSSSAAWRNGVPLVVAAGTTSGTNALNGVTIGATYTGGSISTGQTARVSLFAANALAADPLADLIARTSQFAAACQQHYIMPTIDMVRSDAVLPYGGSTTITATMRDTSGAIIPNYPMSFLVDPPNFGTLSSTEVMTNAFGQASVTYTAPNNLGTATIYAYNGSVSKSILITVIAGS